MNFSGSSGGWGGNDNRGGGWTGSDVEPDFRWFLVSIADKYNDRWWFVSVDRVVKKIETIRNLIQKNLQPRLGAKLWTVLVDDKVVVFDEEYEKWRKEKIRKKWGKDDDKYETLIVKI